MGYNRKQYHWTGEDGKSAEDRALDTFAELMMERIKAIDKDWQKPWIEVRYKRGEVRDYQYVSRDFRDDFNGMNISLTSSLSPVWQWNHNPVDTHWSLAERKGWLTLKALPADNLKAVRNMLTQKVVGYQSQSTTLVTVTGNANGGLFCSGHQFLGIGLCKEGIFIEAHGERQIINRGKFAKVWLRITNDCMKNRHQFYFSTDGEHYSLRVRLSPCGQAIGKASA